MFTYNRPYQNYIVVHKDPGSPRIGQPIQIGVRAGSPGGQLRTQLWLAGRGTPLPRQPGWQPADHWNH
ncbi:hypothetical protein BT63DRAFT_430626 [Microthyrium microscopicum]|uniref:Uncharacterized protein n=1 Tax=Microthyrium microscopicum TaxID=703497 RepID=A0A6A6TT08_9PEZI|nr:hypothetical protein BT63DRAFT_430626 [Microthyrium microscopicum]